MVCVFMFIGKNFSGLGHLKTVGFQIFHVQGCCWFFFFWLKIRQRETLGEGTVTVVNCLRVVKWN